MVLDYLKSKDLHCVPYGDRYRLLSNEFNQNFEAIISVLSQMPLSVEGREHTDSRRAIAQLIASRLADVRKIIPELVSRHLAKLDTPGTVDLMEQVFDPLVHDLLDELAGQKLNLKDNNDVSSIFSKTNGMRRRRKINEQIARIHDTLTSQSTEQSQGKMYQKIVVGILGNDSLRGTFGATLYHVLMSANSTRLSQLDYPKIPNYSGVKFVDRIAIRDTQVCEHAMQVGEEHEVRFDDLHMRETDAEKMALFGAGKHTCLGKGITMDLWDAVVSNLLYKNSICNVKSYKERKDNVFCIPEEFIVEVTLG